MLITFLASWLIYGLYGGLIYLWIIDGRVKKEVALHGSLAAIVAYAISEIVKHFYFDPRPFVINHLPIFTLTKPLDNSFPSGHTAIAFAIAITIWLHNKKIGAVFLVVAIIIGLARVWANVHWPIDIAGGAILGTVVAVAIERLHVYTLLKKKW